MKINKILSVGCSNTVGVNLEEEIGIYDYLKKGNDTSVLGKKVREYRETNNFSTRYANHYAAEVTNLGISGASNERIIFNTVEELESKPRGLYDMVLVNLSGQARMTFEYMEKLFDIDLSYETEHLLEYTDMGKDGYKEFLEFYRNNLFGQYTTHKKQTHLYRYIVTYLESKQIPYLITQTVPTDFKLKDFTDKCIDVTFDDYNEECGRVRARGNHWLSDSHQAWADLLIHNTEELYGRN
jgi:hypothetical protein